MASSACLGIDVGNDTSCVACARRRGVDVLMNKESKRDTPSFVSFNSKQRQMGTDAAAAISLAPASTATNIKRLIGRKFSDPVVQRDLARLPFKVLERADGGCAVEVMYQDQPTQFAVEQLYAMLLVDLKTIAERDHGSPIAECVLSVPSYFREAQRYAVLAAAQVAGLNCLRLVNDVTAAALAYGLYKTDLPETDPMHVAFVDVGHQGLQVCIVALKKGQLQVLSNAWDENVGGREIDELIFNHFADEFKERYKIDVRTNTKASFRLRAAAEKLKKVLSINSEAPINVESIMNDIDVRGALTREQLETMMQPILAAMHVPLLKSLEDAGVKPEQIQFVEVLGGTSRVPAVASVILDVFKREPHRSLNATETPARGCALQCAMLSPTFRVREFQVVECFPFDVNVTFEKEGQQVTAALFPKGTHIPSAKMLTFIRSGTFGLETFYSDVDPSSPERRVASYQIGPVSPSPPHDTARVKVKVRLNLNQLVSLESVTMIEEEAEEGSAAAGPPTTEGVASAEPSASADDVPMADGAPAPEASEEAPSAMEGVEAAGGKAAEEPKKKLRTKKTPVPYQAANAAPDQKHVQGLFEQECELALHARIQEETADKRNMLESYIYSLRNRLGGGDLAPFATEAAASSLLQQTEKLEDWLYEDGEDQPKSVYVEKYDQLKASAAAIEGRYEDSLTRGAAVEALQKAASAYMSAAQDQECLEAGEKDTIRTECSTALSWLASKQDMQSRLTLHDDPALLTSDVKKRQDTLARVCDPLIAKAKAARAAKAKAAAAAASAAAAAAKEKEQAPAAAPPAADAAAPEPTPMEEEEAPAAEAEPMEA